MTMITKPSEIDLIIKKLMNDEEARKKLEEKDIAVLCEMSKKIFFKQSSLLYLNSPLKICGDIHGQYEDLIKIFQFSGFPPKSKYLFLGDYVDRGKTSIETICLLLSFKIKFPNQFFILRGNHESSSINRIYGFYEECKKKYRLEIWKMFCDVFNYLPIAAVVNKKIFCVHGGISPSLTSFNQLKTILRPTEISDRGLLCDLVWSDPDQTITEWKKNERGISFVFGKKPVDRFLEMFKISLICRAHQMVEKGFEFFNNRKLVTIFSAPNYCGEFKNFGAVLSINKFFECKFHILKPLTKKFTKKKRFFLN
ncbi:serine/threonine protein phosphatase type 1 alpha (nucleomorph) [Cryptomonas paramecium]|uniref:Serine/threonine-protein phosphatase n=1 Tax=Cryptomonas paramaecium TaxID=2898 RepID=F2HHI4_9CRYP|nr:serine/threonine protein phosphatase type 1 alpha [Cryptomonas paramecium]AEA38780.1 serine/threonine protein phosphatase type 1 alpha [Cryptomonas paramecium]